MYRLPLATLIFAVVIPSVSDAAFVDHVDTYALSGVTEAERPELAGDIIAEATTPYGVLLNDGTLSLLYGEVQSRVVRSSVDGTIDLYWRIIPETNAFGVPALDGSIASFELGNTRSFEAAYHVDWRADLAGTVAPTTYGGGVNVSGNGFNFGTPLTVGNSSRWFFVDTVFKHFDFLGSFAMSDGNSFTPTFPTFEAIGVPEPSSILLIALGLAVLPGGRMAMRE